jgi:hypothetical protein
MSSRDGMSVFDYMVDIIGWLKRVGTDEGVTKADVVHELLVRMNVVICKIVTDPPAVSLSLSHWVVDESNQACV